jgi:hypothetical protein
VKINTASALECLRRLSSYCGLWAPMWTALIKLLRDTLGDLESARAVIEGISLSVFSFIHFISHEVVELVSFIDIYD